MFSFIFGLMLICVSVLFLMTAIKGLFADNDLFRRAREKNDDDTYDTLDYDFKLNKFVGGKQLSASFIKKIGY